MNADKARPDVYVTLAGDVRKIRFSINAACIAEEQLGVPVLGGVFLRNGFGYRQLRALLFAMLKAMGDAVTPEQVGDLLQSSDLDHVTAAVTEAFRRAFPDSKEEGAGEKKESTAEPA